MTALDLFPGSVDELRRALEATGYVASDVAASTLKIALQIDKPLLVEGEPGVGKTSLASALAACTGTRLIRLQCYEGLDASATLYEWNYAKQLLHLRLAENDPSAREDIAAGLFREEYLLERPLLRALRHTGPKPVVLLIDEVDRADEEFEAFLLELLGEFQVTVPELGTFTAAHRPAVLLTSNRVRDLSDALKRRCLYLWLEPPSVERERQILLRRIPDLPEALAAQVAEVMQRLREESFDKPPGLAEAVDWARALLGLGVARIEAPTIDATAGCFLKSREDLARLAALGRGVLLEGVGAEEGR